MIKPRGGCESISSVMEALSLSAIPTLTGAETLGRCPVLVPCIV